jgi:hypothetical protein
MKSFSGTEVNEVHEILIWEITFWLSLVQLITQPFPWL